MNIVSAVANLQKELDYYKSVSKEQAAIIEQLVSGPGEFEYIHPFDLHDYVMSQDLTFADLYKIGKNDSDCILIVASTGKKYKQSVHIPAKSKKFV